MGLLARAGVWNWQDIGMLERFLDRYRVHEGRPGKLPLFGSPVSKIAAALGGCSFDAGLYRVFPAGEVAGRTALATEAFPEFAGRIQCFGMDWLGRLFATDSSKGRKTDPELLLLEPGTGEALEIPVALSKFHDEELVDYADAVLAVDFYREWLAGGGMAPAMDECVGYRTPLFLGGVDDTTNLQICDVDVYWTLSAQILAQVRDLPDGTPTSNVVITE